MFIKEFIKIELDKNRYYPIYSKNIENITYIAIFFDDVFRHIYRSGTIEFIEKFKTNDRSGMSSEMIALDMDNAHNLAYMSEPTENSMQDITPEIDQLIESQATIELCHRNFIGYAVLTKENLFHLLLKWKQYVDQKVPYILIYLDDNNWHDSLFFETEESMNQFIANHRLPQE